MKEIQLSKTGKNRGKYVALVDDEDFEYLNQFRWHVSEFKNTMYASTIIIINNRKKNTYIHNLIMNCIWIDHKDNNGLNNQKSNLRLCTHKQNCTNRGSSINSSSKYKGVSVVKTRKSGWTSYVYFQGKKYYLGYFRNEIDAAKAHDKKAKELHGEFAHLNFP